MNTGLIAHLNLHIQIREQEISSTYDRVFGFPTGVLRITVEDIVVDDVRGGRLTSKAVPDGLEQTARYQVAIGKTKIRQSTQNLGVFGIAQYQINETTLLLLHHVHVRDLQQNWIEPPGVIREHTGKCHPRKIRKHEHSRQNRVAPE